jgi:hypothetical protein
MPKKGLETPPSTEWEASSSAGMSETDDLQSSSAAETASLLSSDDADAESLLSSSEGNSVNGDFEQTEGDETVQAISMQDLSLAADNPPVNRTQPARARLSSYLAKPSLPDIDSDSGAEVEYSTEDDDDESEDAASVLSESMTEDPSLRTSAAHIPTQNGIAPAPRHALLRQTLQAQHDEGDTTTTTVVTKAILPSAKAINNARSKTGQGRQGGGWRMPEATFSEWVMAR